MERAEVLANDMGFSQGLPASSRTPAEWMWVCTISLDVAPDDREDPWAEVTGRQIQAQYREDVVSSSMGQVTSLPVQLETARALVTVVQTDSLNLQSSS